MAWMIEIARELEPAEPLYWSCFVLAAALGGIGCVALASFVLIQWREHRRAQST